MPGLVRPARPVHPVPFTSMLRLLLAALAILHLGPGIAFALLAFGCDGPAPVLGAVCGQGGFASFAWITVVAWVVLGAAYALLHRRLTVV